MFSVTGGALSGGSRGCLSFLLLGRRRSWGHAILLSRITPIMRQRFLFVGRTTRRLVISLSTLPVVILLNDLGEGAGLLATSYWHR